MPNTNTVFFDNARKIEKELRILYDMIKELGDGATAEQKKFLNTMSDFTGCGSTVYSHLSTADSKYSDTFKDSMAALENGFSQINRNNLPKQVRDQFTKAENTYKEVKPAFTDLVSALDRVNETTDNYQDGVYNAAYLKRHLNRFGLFGSEPTTEQCVSLSFANNDMDEVFSAMLWLRSREYMSIMSVDGYQKDAPGFYQKTLTRLENELSNLPLTRQMEFMEKITVHDMAVKSVLGNTYDRLESRDPGRDTKEHFMAVNMARTPECMASVSIHEWRSEMNAEENPIACDIYNWSNSAFDGSNEEIENGKKLFANDPENAKLSDFVNQKINHFQTAEDKEVTNSLYLKSLTEGSYLQDSFASEFGEEYIKLMADTRSAHSGFTRMKEAIAELAKFPQGRYGDKKEYLNKLRDAQTAVKDYRSEHPGNRITRKGSERVGFADKFDEILTRRIKEVEAIDKEAKYNAGIKITNRYHDRANENITPGFTVLYSAVAEARDKLSFLVDKEIRKSELPKIHKLYATCIVCNAFINKHIDPEFDSEQLDEVISSVAQDKNFQKLTRSIFDGDINEFLTGRGEKFLADQYSKECAYQRAEAHNNGTKLEDLNDLGFNLVTPQPRNPQPQEPQNNIPGLGV